MKHIRILEAFVEPEAVTEEFLRQVQARYGQPGLKLSVSAPAASGPALEAHESLTALNLAVPELVRNAVQAEAQGVDGILINCMADPGVDVLRESVSIPVLGPGHSSMHAAALLGRRFSLLVTTDFSARYFLDYAHRSGLGSRLASIHAVGLPPEELDANWDKTFKLLTEAARQAIVEDRADVLILGCTYFATLSTRLRDALSASDLAVPLIDPLEVSINLLAALAGAGLAQSKLAYPDTGIAKTISAEGTAGSAASGER